MSIDAGGSEAVTLGALNSLEDGPIRGPVGMGACQEGNEAVIELQQAKKHAATGGGSYHVAGGSGICFSYSHIQEHYFLGLGFGDKAIEATPRGVRRTQLYGV